MAFLCHPQIQRLLRRSGIQKRLRQARIVFNAERTMQPVTQASLKSLPSTSRQAPFKRRVGEEFPPHPLLVYGSKLVLEPAVTDKRVC